MRIKFSDIPTYVTWNPEGKWLGRVDPQCVESRRESRAFNHGNNSRSTAKVYCLQYTTDESATDDALMYELVAHFQLALSGEMGEAR